MLKPKEAIERMRMFWSAGRFWDDCAKDVLAYLDSIPEDAHICKWPEGLTRERMADMANHQYIVCQECATPVMDAINALRALAAIAPERPKKRKVAVWMAPNGEMRGYELVRDKSELGWRKVGECEIEE